MKSSEVLAKFKAAFMLLGIGLLLLQPVGCVSSRPPRPRRHVIPAAFPITILVDTDITPNRAEEILYAAHTWNEEVGVDIFNYGTMDISDFISYGELIESPNRNEIFTMETELGRAENGDNLLGLAHRYFTDDDLTGCVIEFDDDIAIESVYQVTMHELGHCLGLEHDDTRNSVMYEYVLQSTGDIEEEDLEYIRNHL